MHDNRCFRVSDQFQKIKKKVQRIFAPAVGPGLHSKISVIFTMMSDLAGSAGFVMLSFAFI